MSEPSMVEKVARAAYEKFIEAVRDLEPSWEGLPQSHRDRLIDSQRSAIEVMREPTDIMCRAPQENRTTGARRSYQAMIDAALQEGKEGK